VRDEQELRVEGFGGLVGVGRGSSRPPRFVELGYVPQGSDGHEPHAVLVGKGIVFDSGGISIKPAAGMETMKTDMAGAAAVIAVLGALRDLDARVRVTGLLAIAENLPGADAQRPSDVITPYGATRTVEVINTDAEGRLVLADGLAYADAVLEPDVVVDIATLTGAVSLALGRRDAGLFASDEGLAAAIERAAGPARERVWRLPLVEDYRPALDSTTADLVNAVTDRSVGGGAIMAALFLREFTGGRPWAHLDIAGTGRSDADVDELSRGATGFGVRLLLRWLTSGRLR
jgi:leucyl aminopeptidase